MGKVLTFQTQAHFLRGKRKKKHAAIRESGVFGNRVSYRLSDMVSSCFEELQKKKKRKKKVEIQNPLVAMYLGTLSREGFAETKTDHVHPSKPISISFSVFLKDTKVGMCCFFLQSVLSVSTFERG